MWNGQFVLTVLAAGCIEIGLHRPVDSAGRRPTLFTGADPLDDSSDADPPPGWSVPRVR